MSGTTQLTEAALVERALAGDREAFGVLVNRHLRPAYGLAFALTGSREESEDLAQETFLRAWRNLGTLRRRESFTSWIGAMVRNLAATGRRGELRRRRALEAISRVRPAEASDERERMEKSEAETFLRQALDGLPEDLRTPLVLFYFEGESTARVAERLRLRPATARKRIQLARDRLRDTLLERLAGALAVIAPGPEVFRRIEAALADAPAGSRRARPRSSSAPGALGTGIIVGGLIMSAKKLGALSAVGLLLAATVLVVADPLGWRSPRAVSRPPAASLAEPLIGVERTQSAKEAEKLSEPARLEAPSDAGEPVKVVSGIVIDSRTALPIEGAVIRAGVHTGGKPVQGVAPCRTGPDGRFRWTVPATQLSFETTAPGYAPSGGTAKEDSEEVVALDPVLPITGWVVDEDDEPIGGARIEVVQVKILSQMAGRGSSPVFTAADGSFRLDPPMTGQTRLAVEKSGRGGTIADRVPPGAEDVVIRLPEGGRVEGKVFDGPEAPAAAACVRWTTLEPNGPTWSGETVTSLDGSFVIDGIPAPGVHRVYLDGVQGISLFSEDGFADLAREVRVERGETVTGVVLDRGLLPALVQADEQRKEERHSQAMTNPEPRSPSWRFGFWGRIFDSKGKPVPYAQVFWEISYESGSSGSYVRSDAEGRFAYEPTNVFTHFPGNACQARLIVSHGAFADYTSEFRDVPLPVPTPEGAKVMIGPFEVRLREGFRVTGRVRGPDGRPQGSVQVYKLRRGDTGFKGYYTSTGENGSFEVPHASPTLRGLVLYHPQAAPLQVSLTAAAGVPDGQTFDVGEIRLEAGTTVRGVLSRADGSPAPGFEVILDDQQFYPAARTDEGGRFVLEHLPAGKHGFWLSPEARLAPGSEGVVIAPGEVERDVEIQIGE